MDPELNGEVGAFNEPDSDEQWCLDTPDGSQVLQAEQVTSIINMVLDATGDGLLRMIPAQNRLAMNATTRDVTRMSLPDVGIVFGLGDGEHLDPQWWTVGEYDHRSLALTTWDGHINLTQYGLDDDIRGAAGAEAQITAAFQTVVANNLEQSAWQSILGGPVYAGQHPNWLTTWNGWAMLLAEGNVLDAGGAGVGPAIFQQLVETLPLPLQPTNSNAMEYMFMCSKRVYFAWRQYLQNRATPLGDMQLIDGDIPAYGSIPLVPMNYILNDAPGVLSLSGGAGAYSFVALARAAQFFVGYKPQMVTWRAPHPEDGKTINLHWRGRIGFQMDVPEWTAMAVNVNPVAAT